jgi:hypothetical protein
MCTVTELDVSNAQVGASLESINTSEIVHEAAMTDDMSLIGLQKNDKLPEKMKSQQTENLVNCEVQCEMSLNDPPNQQDDLNMQDQNKAVQFEEKIEAKNSALKGSGVKQTITMLGYINLLCRIRLRH